MSTTNDKHGRQGASKSPGRTSQNTAWVVRGNAREPEQSEPPPQRLPEPAGLCAAGRGLWQAVTDDYELEHHEALLLEQAARTADVVAALDSTAPADGDLLADGRVRPEVVEARQQRLLLARLLAALRVPLGEPTENDKHGMPRLQRRDGARVGVRGVYSIGPAS